MELSCLGNTGIEVSRLALGTVELGIDYGFRGSACYQKPDAQDAVRTIHRALDLGINLIDTARDYGSSEELIGRALAERRGAPPIIATKVCISEELLRDGKNPRMSILGSIEASLRAMRVETVDLLQIHNTSARILASEEAMRALEDVRRQGKVRFLGASSDDEAVSLAALEVASLRVLQTPFNLLNRAILPRVMPRAAHQGVAILARSAFLRGVLTGIEFATPPALSKVRDAALAIWGEFQHEARSLSEIALRFCLSFAAVSSVVIGVRSVSELDHNIANAALGPLSPGQLERLRSMVAPDPWLVDPRNWRDLI